MKKRTLAVLAALALGTAAAAWAADAKFHEVKPNEFDPAKTHLVNAAWIEGTGCPTNATTYNGTTTSTFTDPACPTGDSKDKKVDGLLLVKTGPTTNFAEAFAELKEAPATVTELGYDIRKPGTDRSDPRGSHCGGGAPRFTIVFKDGTSTFGPGCSTGLPVTQTPGTGWIRLRFPVSFTNVKSIFIEFDEGQDLSGGPDQSGLAVIDNVDVNGTLVGTGPDDSNSG